MLNHLTAPTIGALRLPKTMKRRVQTAGFRLLGYSITSLKEKLGKKQMSMPTHLLGKINFLEHSQSHPQQIYDRVINL